MQNSVPFEEREQNAVPLKERDSELRISLRTNCILASQFTYGLIKNVVLLRNSSRPIEGHVLQLGKVNK